MHKIISITALLIAGSLIQACFKAETSVPSKTLIEKYKTIEADTSVHFVFFSFEQSKVLAFTDSPTARWDVAFKDSVLLTNNGVSGPGKGGGLVFKGVYDDIPCFPDTVAIDIDSTQARAINTTWFENDPTTSLIKLIPARTILIRTGNGKFAKMEVMKFYDEKNGVKRRGLYTFRYTYQSNGTKQLTDTSICK